MSCFTYSKFFALSNFFFFLGLNVAITFNHPSTFLRFQCMHKSPEKLTEMQISLGRVQGHDGSKLAISFKFIIVLLPMSANLRLRSKNLNPHSSPFCSFWGHHHCNPHLKGPSNVSDMLQHDSPQAAIWFLKASCSVLPLYHTFQCLSLV